MSSQPAVISALEGIAAELDALASDPSFNSPKVVADVAARLRSLALSLNPPHEGTSIVFQIADEMNKTEAQSAWEVHERARGESADLTVRLDEHQNVQPPKTSPDYPGWRAEQRRLSSRHKKNSETAQRAYRTAAEKGIIRLWCEDCGLVTEAVRLPDGGQSDCLLCIAKWEFYGLE